jgi:hypothetical protein
MSDGPCLGDEERENAFVSVRERDLDHFLIEELQASSAFRSWFVGHLGEGFQIPVDALVRTERSPPRLTDNRQTDLRLAYYNPDGTIAAVVLVECKVADGFQEEQAEDYSREVVAWREQLGSARAASILAAPRNNQRLTKRHHFDGFVAIDDMAVILKARRDAVADGELRERLAIRADLLEALAGKRSKQWNPQPVRERVMLAAIYDRVVRERLADFSVNSTTSGKRADDRFFGEFPGAYAFHGNVILKHRIYQGVVCLEFRNSKITNAMMSMIRLPEDGSIVPHWTGKTKETLQLRAKTLPLRDYEDDLAQQSRIAETLDAVKSLTTWFSSNVALLNSL